MAPSVVVVERTGGSSSDPYCQADVVCYKVEDPALGLVETWRNDLTQDELEKMLNFLDREISKLSQTTTNLTTIQQHLDQLMTTLDSYIGQSSSTLTKPVYTHDNLYNNYIEWLKLWDEKIQSATGEWEQWKSMRDKYVTQILKKHFGKVFQDNDNSRTQSRSSS